MSEVDARQLNLLWDGIPTWTQGNSYSSHKLLGDHWVYTHSCAHKNQKAELNEDDLNSSVEEKSLVHESVGAIEETTT